MVRNRTLLDILAYAAALLGFLPLFPHLDLPARIVFPLALAAGALGDRSGRHPFRPAFTTALTAAVFIFYAAQVGPGRLVEPAVNLLVLLLAVRLLGAKGGREHLQILVLSLFALAASSLLDLSIAYLAFLVPMIFVVSAGLVLLAFHSVEPGAVFDRRELRRVGGAALALPLVSTVLMFALFLVLPRARHPLLPFFQSQATAAGLNDRVVPGAFASPEGKGRPVFRVEVSRLPPGELYWRGVVLSRLREGAWLRDSTLREDAEVAGGTPLRQVFYPEPGPGPFLPALDHPVEITGTPHRRGDDLVFTAPGEFRRVRYKALSRRGAVLNVRGSADRELYLQLPPALSPRVAEAAASVAAGAGDREKIARLEAFFLARRLTYSQNIQGGSADPVDDFLFVTRRGWCEHFATSFALMLRLAGVPSRLVGGYYGGDYNELGGYYLVTEEMAHLWVEALVDGREWVRLDPTRLAQEAGGGQGGGLGPGRRLLDAVDYYWNRMVIGYDLDRQMDVLREAGERAGNWRPDLSSLGWVLGGGGAVLLLPAALGRLRRRGSREARLLRRYHRRVTRRYRLGELPPSTGLQELASRVGDPACREFSEIFGGALYRDRALTQEEYRRLKRLIRKVGEEGG